MNILSIRLVDMDEGLKTGLSHVTVRIGFAPHEAVIQRSTYRNWIEDHLESGQILEAHEDRQYTVLASWPRGGRRARTLTYFFPMDSDAVAFRLAFNDEVYHEPDPLIYLRTR